MNRETIAAIDIGSNAIRLLINYVEQNGTVSFKKAAFIRVPIRLGEDVFTSGKVGDDKKERMLDAMIAFSHLLKTFKVKNYRACATSAMRDASNGAEITTYIKERCGIDIEIISGKEEAKTIFEAGDSAGLIGDKNYLFVDVGGGSTEVTVYSNKKRVDSESFALGTVRMISNAVEESEVKRFKEWLKRVSAEHNPVEIIGSGGNINKVHKLLAKKEREPLNYVELRLLYDHLKEMNFQERVSKLGLNTYRADVIMPAMKIFLTAAKYCKISEIIVPKIGLADGIIRHLYAQEQIKR